MASRSVQPFFSGPPNIEGSIQSPGSANLHPHVTQASLGLVQNQNDISVGSAIFHSSPQCPFPLKCAFAWGDLDPNLTHGLLAHLSPNPKWHLDRFSFYCTAHGRESVYFTPGRPYTLKLPLHMGDLNSYLIYGSWTHPNPQPKRHLDRFRCFCTVHGRASLYFAMGRPLPSKLPIAMGNLDPLSNIRFLNPNGILIGSAVLQGSLTDRETMLYSVGNYGRICVSSTAMRP